MYTLVSIHAPTGGATCFCPGERIAKLSFNPRAHGGRDAGNRAAVRFA